MKEKDTRAEFFAAVDQGAMTLAETVRKMRKSIGMTQVEYAKLAGVAPRILIDLERGVGNPTLQSLIKLAQPFGLELSLRRKR